MAEPSVSKSAIDFLVRQRDLRQTDVRELRPPAEVQLGEGDVLVSVDRFAFTANNTTYAALGDKFSYWRFFPVREDDEDAWGRVPVWGFGTVLRSKAPAVAEGERLFGFFPMSSYVVLHPLNVKAWGFVDGSPHRAELFPLYNQYTRTSVDPAYDPAKEAEQMILRPLFLTSFALDDFLHERAFEGADTVLLASASSKTAIGLAFLLSERRRRPDGGREGIEVVGLTSPRNAPFVQGLGYYDRVITYDALASLPGKRIVQVDFAGSAPLMREVQTHAGERLVRTHAVGFTHWDERASSGPKPTSPRDVFFVPAQIKKRSDEWGAARFQARFGEAWRSFVSTPEGAPKWLHIHEHRGEGAVRRVYLDVLDGRAKPDEGLILALSRP